MTVEELMAAVRGQRIVNVSADHHVGEDDWTKVSFYLESGTVLDVTVVGDWEGFSRLAVDRRE